MRAAALLLLACAAVASAAAQRSLRFHGNGAGDVDRVKIRLDDPATTDPGPPDRRREARRRIGVPLVPRLRRRGAAVGGAALRGGVRPARRRLQLRARAVR
jgi:hypothetical protein